MSEPKAKRPSRLGQALLDGMGEALAHARGENVPGLIEHKPIDPRELRRRHGLSQQAFAQTFGVPYSTVRDWEQGKSTPQGAARTLLHVIALAPETVKQAVLKAPAT